MLKNNGYINYYLENKKITFKISSESICDTQYYFDELIISINEEIQTVNIKNGENTKFKYLNVIEYFLCEYHSTFTTYHLNEDDIYFENIEFNEKTKSFSKSLKMINHSIDTNRVENEIKDPLGHLKNFNFYKPLPEILDSKVKFYHQMGKYELKNYSAICVMEDNKVYGFGCNRWGILGFGHQRIVNEFRLIEELSHQNIEEFFGQNNDGYKGFMFARNNRNQIFSWGYNSCGTLCRGNYSFEIFKPNKIGFFENKNLIEICCGEYHCLGLTEDGILYGWGHNRYGQTGSRSKDNLIEYSPIRILISESIEKRNIVKFIHCSGDTSCAVTVKGRAYLWGKVDGRETFIPKNLDTNVSKIFLNNLSNISMITKEGIFKLYKQNEKILEVEKVSDLLDYNIFEKHDILYEVHDRGMMKTNFSHYHEYLLYKRKEIDSTIHITSDGFLQKHRIKVNENYFKNLDGKLLEKSLSNIFDQKLENNFDPIIPIGEGGYGIVFKVKAKSSDALFAIKRMEIKGIANIEEF